MTFVIEKQVVCVVQLLEEMSTCRKLGVNLFLLSLKAAPGLFASSVIIHVLETLRGVNISELLAKVILFEVKDQFGDVVRLLQFFLFLCIVVA